MSTKHIDTTTKVTQYVNGISHSVPEWKGHAHKGKPAVVTDLAITYTVTESGVQKPKVAITAYPVKKDGTPSQNRIDTQFWSVIGNQSLTDELVEQYGGDAEDEARAIWQKLHG